LEQAQLDYKKL